MRKVLALLVLVGCGNEVVHNDRELTVYTDSPGWSTDIDAAMNQNGLNAQWVESPEAADIRIRVFTYSDCPTDSAGKPMPAYSCPGGPIAVWPTCGPATVAMARHIKLRAADPAGTKRVDYCTSQIDL